MAWGDTSPVDIVKETSEDVKEIIDAKFLTAQEYANAAFTAAQTALTALSNFASHPTIDTNVDVEFEYDGADIVSSLVADKPTMPNIDATFDIDPPVLDTLRELPVFDSVVSDIRSALAERIATLVVEGATGLDADVEAMIWDRMRSRQEVENTRLYTEAEQYFSSRGYTLPPGVLAGRLNEIGIEIARNNSYVNNDISVEQARLAQTNQHWVLEKGVFFVLEDIKITITSIIEYNKNVVAVFTARVEKFKADVESKIAVIEALVKKYTAEAEVFKSIALVASIDLEAQAKNAELHLKKASIIAELKIKAAEIALELAAKLHALQVEALKAAGQVASQLAASALSSVNATASLGFGANASGSSGFSYEWDMTKGIEEGKRTIYQHNFDETAEQ